MARVLCFLFSLLVSTYRPRLSPQLEIAALRHQLSAYRLIGQGPRIAPPDRLLCSVIAKLWSRWRRTLFFVQPRAVTLWQQKRFRDHWRVLSQDGHPPRPKIAPEMRGLISSTGCPASPVGCAASQASPAWSCSTSAGPDSRMVEALGGSPIVGKALGSGLALLWNFVARYWWVIAV